MSKLPYSSPNFGFLEKHSELLVRYAAQAERYLFDDPNTALIKLRQFGELLANLSAAHMGDLCDDEDNFLDVLRRLSDRGLFTPRFEKSFTACVWLVTIRCTPTKMKNEACINCAWHGSSASGSRNYGSTGQCDLSGRLGTAKRQSPRSLKGRS